MLHIKWLKKSILLIHILIDDLNIDWAICIIDNAMEVKQNFFFLT